MNPLLNDAQQALRERAQAAVELHVAPAADRIDTEGVGAEEVLAALAEAGLLGGGEGEQPMLDIALEVEQIARKSAALAAVAAAHGVARMWLAGAADAPAGALAGNPLVAITTGAVEAGPSDDGYRLEGESNLTPGAALAQWFLVDAGGGEAGLYLVPADAAGVNREDVVSLLGLNGAGVARVRFSGATFPGSSRLGGAEEAAAVRDLLCVAHGAVAVGIARGALDAALAEVEQRREDGDRIDRSQSVQWILADNATETEAARVAVWYAACQPPGEGLAEAAALGRVLAAEAAVQSTRRTLQVFGERGLTRAAGVERSYRDAKLMEVLGGTNEAHLARVAQHLLPELTGR